MMSKSTMIPSIRLRIPKVCLQCRYTSTTSSSSAPPIQGKIRKDMITALKAKDTNRLNVLRALLSETTNAAKTSQPIQTDMQFLSLLKKRVAASKAAAMEFGQANREDLKSKEEEQVRVLEEYAGSVETMSEEEIGRVVGEVVGELRRGQGQGEKVALGGAMKVLFEEGGRLCGRPVEKGVVVGIVRRILDGSGDDRTR